MQQPALLALRVVAIERQQRAEVQAAAKHDHTRLAAAAAGAVLACCCCCRGCCCGKGTRIIHASLVLAAAGAGLGAAGIAGGRAVRRQGRRHCRQGRDGTSSSVHALMNNQRGVRALLAGKRPTQPPPAPPLSDAPASACPNRGAGVSRSFSGVQRSLSSSLKPASSQRSSKGPLSRSPPNSTT